MKIYIQKVRLIEEMLDNGLDFYDDVKDLMYGEPSLVVGSNDSLYLVFSSKDNLTLKEKRILENYFKSCIAYSNQIDSYFKFEALNKINELTTNHNIKVKYTIINDQKSFKNAYDRNNDMIGINKIWIGNPSIRNVTYNKKHIPMIIAGEKIFSDNIMNQIYDNTLLMFNNNINKDEFLDYINKIDV